MKAVLKDRGFYGPDGRLYRRTDGNGETLVHDFPDDWQLPKGTMTVEEASKELKKEPEAPEPRTLKEMQRGGKK